MLSSKQLENITKVGGILRDLVETKDDAKRGIMSAAGCVYLEEILEEELDELEKLISKDKDFLKR